MPDMPRSLSSTMLKAAVYGVYQGTQASELKPADSATRWLDRDGSGGISQVELREGMARDQVVLSLRQPATGFPPVVQPGDLADRVATWMDAADGHQDGWVDFGTNPLSPGSTSWPEDRIAKGDVAARLAAGDWVIGTQLMDRREAQAYGKTVTELETAAPGSVRTVSLVQVYD